jgi:hypothetical protein
MTSSRRRCCRAVDALSDGSPTLTAIEEEPHRQVGHAFWLGKPARPAYHALDPCAHVDVRALALLRMCLPNGVLLCLHIAPVALPTVGER